MSTFTDPPRKSQTPSIQAAHPRADKGPIIDCDRREVPAGARQLAARLAELFEADVEIVRLLNDAHRRLRDANDQLWLGLAPEAIGLLYGGPAPAAESRIATLVREAIDHDAPGAHTALLQALQQTHWSIHRAICDYQSASERRRQHAVSVGELSAQLTAVLCAAGWSELDTRRADVRTLASEHDSQHRPVSEQPLAASLPTAA